MHSSTFSNDFLRGGGDGRTPDGHRTDTGHASFYTYIVIVCDLVLDDSDFHQNAVVLRRVAVRIPGLLAAGVRSVLDKARVIVMRLSLRAKFKQSMSLLQVMNQIGGVYVVQLPAAVAALMAPFKALNFSLIDIGLPLECVGLHSFELQLAAMMVLPLALALLVHDAPASDVGSWSDADQMGPDLTTGVAAWTPIGMRLQREAPWEAPHSTVAVGGWLGTANESDVFADLARSTACAVGARQTFAVEFNLTAQQAERASLSGVRMYSRLPFIGAWLNDLALHERQPDPPPPFPPPQVLRNYSLPVRIDFPGHQETGRGNPPPLAEAYRH